jgi:hypothetical protein
MFSVEDESDGFVPEPVSSFFNTLHHHFCLEGYAWFLSPAATPAATTCHDAWLKSANSSHARISPRSPNPDSHIMQFAHSTPRQHANPTLPEKG